MVHRNISYQITQIQQPFEKLLSKKNISRQSQIIRFITPQIWHEIVGSVTKGLFESDQIDSFKVALFRYLDAKMSNSWFNGTFN